MAKLKEQVSMPKVDRSVFVGAAAAILSMVGVTPANATSYDRPGIVLGSFAADKAIFVGSGRAIAERNVAKENIAAAVQDWKASKSDVAVTVQNNEVQPRRRTADVSQAAVAAVVGGHVKTH